MLSRSDCCALLCSVSYAVLPALYCPVFAAPCVCRHSVCHTLLLFSTASAIDRSVSCVNVCVCFRCAQEYLQIDLKTIKRSTHIYIHMHHVCSHDLSVSLVRIRSLTHSRILSLFVPTSVQSPTPTCPARPSRLARHTHTTCLSSPLSKCPSLTRVVLTVLITRLRLLSTQRMAATGCVLTLTAH